MFSSTKIYRKCVEENGFLSIAKKCSDKYGKKLIDTATKTGIDAAKNCFQKGSSKNCRSYRRFNWKQQAKQKVKKKKMKQKKTRGLHTTREKTASNRLFKIASDTKQKRHTKKLQT